MEEGREQVEVQEDEDLDIELPDLLAQRRELNDKIAELKDAHPEVELFLVDVGYEPVIFRSMDRALYADVRKKIDGLTDQTKVEETVCDACVFYPEKEKYAELKNRKGGFCTTLAEEIFRTSGFSVMLAPVKL